MPRHPRPHRQTTWPALPAAWLLCSVLAAQAQRATPAPTTPPQAASCAACHGATGNPSLPGLPLLAGQTARYLKLQLRDFQDGRRGHSRQASAMQDLTRSDLRTLAAWSAAQAPPTTQTPRPTTPADAARARLGKTKADEALCTNCHLGGFAGQGEIPRVAGQPMDCVLQQLRAFAPSNPAPAAMTAAT